MNDDKGAGIENGLLQLLVHLRALVCVALEQGGFRFLVSSGMSQELRQESVLILPASELSGLLAKVWALEFGSK